MTLSDRIKKAERASQKAARQVEVGKAETRIRNVSTEETVRLLMADVRK